MASTKKRNYKKKSLSKRNKTPKYNNKRKAKHQKRRKMKTRKLYKMKGCNKQKGGISATNLVSHSLLNAARFVPHTITNVYNGLVGNASATNFLPWAGHYA